jgi:hypothetical protein
MDIQLNNSDIDHHIELFWYGFKQSMINFYTKYNKKYEHIYKWSNTLNKFKLEKKYEKIESEIREYMTYYSFDLIKYSKITHDDSIFITNIKRWNKITSKFNFTDSIKYCKILNIFMVYLELKNLKQYNILSELEPVEKIIENNNFTKIVLYALHNDKSRLLELLKQIPDYDLILTIQQLYPNFKCNYIMKMNKLCNEYKKYINLEKTSSHLSIC